MRRPGRPVPCGWRKGWRRYLTWTWQVTPWLHLSVDLSVMNLPRVMIDDGRPRRWWSLSWGNGNSDPVWSIDVERGSIFDEVQPDK